MNLLDLLIFIGIAVAFFGMAVAVLVMAIRVRKLIKLNVQTQMDNFILLSELDKMVQEKDNKSVEQSDGFLKFISESRDWAFEYIENIQSALNEYDAALHTTDAKVINDAYKKLIDLLPKSEDMVN